MYERTITYSKIELLSGTDIYQLCRENFIITTFYYMGPQWDSGVFPDLPLPVYQKSQD